MKYGYIKVAAAIPCVKVADIEYNLEQIETIISKAEKAGVEVVVFPELSITGYTCQDLFRQQILLDKAENAILQLLAYTRNLNIIAVVGLPIRIGSLLYNCAAVLQAGTILGLIPKTYLPNYNEFYEKRWFASASDLSPQIIYFANNHIEVTPEPIVFRTCDGVGIGIEICEDVWAPLPPSNNLALAGAEIILNLSATNELLGKHQYLCSLLSQQSARMMCGYVYSSCGFGESTQDVVYGGNALIFENGRQISKAERFSLSPQIEIQQIDVELLRSERQNNTTFRTAQYGSKARFVDAHRAQNISFELMRDIDPHPFIPTKDYMNDSCEEVLGIQTMGLCKRLHHTHCNNVVIGISGGLDSTLALLVTVRAFDKLGLSRKGIIGVTMPGFGTTDRTHDNAVKLMDSLDISQREINISAAVSQHFSDIGHDILIHDVTYENSQARERTQLLMDIANQMSGLVIGTGDLSELALGWCTYNGDHMSMYGVNVGVPKTLVQYLINYISTTPSFSNQREILLDIIDTPISPELIPADNKGNIIQKTEDLVGPYELHDFFLFYFVRFNFRPSKIFMLAKKAFDSKYDDETIKHWLHIFLQRFFSQQFKRSCLPDGPKVGSVSLSPRGDWRMPSDASNIVWVKSIENI